MRTFAYNVAGDAKIRAEDYADGIGNAKRIVLSQTISDGDRIEFSFDPDMARKVAKQMNAYARFLKPTTQERAAKKRRRR